MPDGVVTARLPPDPTVLGEETQPEFEYFLAEHLPAGLAGAGESPGEPPPQRYEEPIF
jgi:hypothetical protein